MRHGTGTRKRGQRKRNRARFRKHKVQVRTNNGTSSTARSVPKVLKTHTSHSLDSVRILGLTKEKIELLWNKVIELGLTSAYQESYEIFCAQLFDLKTVILEIPDMRAIYYMTGITPNGNADVTLIVFDKKLLGQRELYLQMIQKMMLEFNLRRVTAMVPDWNKIAQNLASKIGFTLEGVLRNWGQSNGVPNDVLLYGLLREELITPESKVH